MFLENWQNSEKNTCARVSFLINCRPQACNFIKKDSGTGIFLWILPNFWENFFYTRPLDDCFWNTYFQLKMSLVIYWQSALPAFNNNNSYFLTHSSPSDRSNRSQMFFEIVILKNFAIFTGKHLCWSLFFITLQVFILP